MTTSRPTPPPWKAYNQEVYWTINATDNRGGPWLVAQVTRTGDAHLIAAAPELLDVCKRLMEAYRRGFINLPDELDMISECHAAIDKAEGRES